MVKNLLLVIVIIAGTALLFSEDTFSEAGEAVDPVTAQAACYAGILGIPTPRVYDRKYTFGETMGVTYETISGVKVELYQGRSVQTSAHELRHAWQIANGWSYEKDTPYELRRAEIDARNWASKNWSRCTLGKTVRQRVSQPISKAANSCEAYLVSAGDSWYGIARKFGKGSDWIDQRSQQGLHPNQEVCI